MVHDIYIIRALPLMIDLFFVVSSYEANRCTNFFNLWVLYHSVSNLDYTASNGK